MDEVLHLYFVILLLDRIFFKVGAEVQMTRVGSLRNFFANWCLSTAKRTLEEQALRKDCFLGLSIDLIDGASSINMVHFAKLFIVINHWQRLREVSIDSLLNGHLIVICPPTCLCSLHASFQHLLFRHIIKKNLVRFNDVLLKVVGLIEGTWKTVNQIRSRFWWHGDQTIYQYLNRDLERHQFAFFLNFLDLLAKFRVLGRFSSHQVARRNVREAELLHDPVTLRALSGCRAAQHKNYFGIV